MGDLKYDDISKIEKLEVDLSKDDVLLASFSISDFLYDEKGEIVDIGAVSFLQILNKNEKGKFEYPIHEEMVEKALTNEGWKEFNKYIYSLGKMNRLAEEIYDKLKDVIKAYLVKYSLECILNRNSSCRKNKNYSDIGFHKLTFMNLKNILSCIITTDDFFSFSDIEGIKSNERKNFSKIFSEYIERRDYYTHGKLYLLYPSEEPILKIQIGEKEEYIKYKKENFIDNLKMFMYLKKVLDEMRQKIQNRDLKT